MTIRQELLKQAEYKLDNYLERVDEAVLEITDDDELSYDLCRILSTKRTASIRQRVMRRFADAAEAKIVAKFNNQTDLNFEGQSGTSIEKETL